MAEETTIMDWGSDMAACIAWIKEHPCPAALAAKERETKRTEYPEDKGRTMDRMFDRTRYEQRSYEAYGRLVDQGHRA